MTLRVADLDARALAEALRLLGVREVPAHRHGAARELRARLADHRTVRDLLERAPDEAREAFRRLAGEGPARVEDLLDRGWAGRGMLPAPLDWLQRRALVAPGADGRVHALAEPREALATPTLGLEPEPASDHLPSEQSSSAHPPTPERRGGEARVLAARSVVVADPETLDRLTAVAELGLEAVSDTVAVATAAPEEVQRALRAEGVDLIGEHAVTVDAAEAALPNAPQRAVGPKQVRALLERALAEQRQVWVRYFASSRAGATTERTVDPWRLRDDLLVGWCHLRRDQRTFAVGRIGEAVMLPEAIDHHEPGAS